VNRHILSLNAGSSSLKFALFNESAERSPAVLSGSVSGIGSDQQCMTIRFGHDEADELVHRGIDHAAAFDWLMTMVAAFPGASISMIGHRIVHGGNKFQQPVLIDRDVINELLALVEFAPLHQPVQIRLIESVRERFPKIPQVACFDTAIHHTLPEVAARFPLPKWLWDEEVRRHGFHGISCESVLATSHEFRTGRTIIAHLGNGSSITALRDGISIDTSMGFTPTGGIMMGTRCGDLDPGVMLYLLRRHHLTAEELDQLVNHESGLKGVSGMTSDVRTLLQSAADHDVQLALDMFAYQAAKQIGGM